MPDGLRSTPPGSEGADSSGASGAKALPKGYSSLPKFQSQSETVQTLKEDVTDVALLSTRREGRSPSASVRVAASCPDRALHENLMQRGPRSTPPGSLRAALPGTHEVAALYVETNGVYFGDPSIDPWDEPRDARLYGGVRPVVAHPPCSRWCQLAYIIQARYGHQVGDDGGMFKAALAAVRRWGGVLEHPAFSYAWARYDLPRPRSGGGWSQSLLDEGWVCEVSQAAYGHPARKLTWLYYVGAKPPHELRWNRPEPTAIVSNCANHFVRDLPRILKAEAARTPEAFRDELLRLARDAQAIEVAA